MSIKEIYERWKHERTPLQLEDIEAISVLEIFNGKLKVEIKWGVDDLNIETLEVDEFNELIADWASACKVTYTGDCSPVASI